MRILIFLFTLLILFLPTQLGRHFWPQWSYVWGLRVDYLSPTIYLTDILTFAILGLWLTWEKFKSQNSKVKPCLPAGRIEIQKSKFLPIIFLLFLFFSSLVAARPAAAFYKLLKIAEFAGLGFFVAKNEWTRKVVERILPWAVICSAVIALLQFFHQHSLAGIFWWLGERPISLSAPGVAKAIVGGRFLLRPYATFPHPNVLAGFLIVALILTWTSFRNRFGKFVWLYGGLAFSAIVISFSRPVWLAVLWLAVLCFSRILMPRKLKSNFLWWLGLLLISAGFIGFTWRFSLPLALEERLALAKAAIAMWVEIPLSGVGLNNFLVNLPKFWPQTSGIYLLQPVHNIFLLIFAETGLVGLTTSVWWLLISGIRAMERKKMAVVLSLGLIIFLGTFDHYWLTLQQGQLLMAIVLGLSWQEGSFKLKKGQVRRRR